MFNVFQRKLIDNKIQICESCYGDGGAQPEALNELNPRIRKIILKIRFNHFAAIATKSNNEMSTNCAKLPIL